MTHNPLDLWLMLCSLIRFRDVFPNLNGETFIYKNRNHLNNIFKYNFLPDRIKWSPSFVSIVCKNLLPLTFKLLLCVSNNRSFLTFWLRVETLEEGGNNERRDGGRW